MSEQEAEATETILPPPPNHSAFAELMGVLLPDEDDETTEEGGDEAVADEAPAGQPVAAPEGTEPEAAVAAAPPVGGEFQPDVPYDTPDDPFRADGPTPAVGSIEAAELRPLWTAMSNTLEEQHIKGNQQIAFNEVRQAFPKYFESLSRHPRELVGMEVPAVNGSDEMETLRDGEDAKQWQDAVRTLLGKEISARTRTLVESERGSMNILHSSVEMFQRNPDLVPFTKTFDRRMADRFAELVRDYEIRVDGRLLGYNIDVQPLIAQLRNTMKREAASRPATATPQPVKKAVRTPQAGIQSTSGASAADSGDFSTLFGTIGLPDFRI